MRSADSPSERAGRARRSARIASVAFLALMGLSSCGDDAEPEKSSAQERASAPQSPTALAEALQTAWTNARASLDGIGGEPWARDLDVERALAVARESIDERIVEARAERTRVASLPSDDQRALVRRNLEDRLKQARELEARFAALRTTWDADAPALDRVHARLKARGDSLAALAERGLQLERAERVLRDHAETWNQALRMWSGAMLLLIDSGAEADPQPRMVAAGSIRNLDAGLATSDPDLARGAAALQRLRLAEARLEAALRDREGADAERLRTRLDALRSDPIPDLDALESRVAAAEALLAEV